ncbi:MAG: hypothetical protein JNK80_11270, partial [Dechloromonas sp.]|nr:hypothetical protein [Dechloromonas sp.]
MKTVTHSRWLMVTALLGAACLPPQAVAEEAEQGATLPAGNVFGIAAVDSEDLAISRGGAELDITLSEARAAGL